MSDHSSRLAFRCICRQAVFWDWRLRDPNLPDSEFQRFLEWHADAAHRATLDAVATIRERSNQTPQRSGANVPAALPQSRSRASLLALAAVAWLAMTIIGPEIRRPSTRILQTEAIASASVLDDQSIVRRAPDTELRFTSDKHRRSSYLSRGRAFFQVAHDPARPFVVQTPVAVVTALGTQFDVSNDSSASVVTVLDGTVVVSPVHSDEVSPRSANPAPIYLHAGEQIRVSSRGRSFISCVDLAEELAWATLIEFKSVPILPAIEQFSQRSGIRLALENPRIARNFRLSGAFQLDDPKGFAQLVARTAGITVLLYGPESTVERVKPQAAQLREERR